MRYQPWSRRDPIRNRFLLPNEIYTLNLTPGAPAIYSYLIYCKNRKTYQYRPSCRTIGKVVRMSVNTVRKHVSELEERGLIVTEPTTVTTKDGWKRNGNLLYTISPIQEAVDLHDQRLLRQVEETTERLRIEKLMANQKCPT